jgi:hypothetical protein
LPGAGFKIADAYRFAATHGLEAESLDIQASRVDPRIKKQHVPRKGAFVKLFEDRGQIGAFAQLYWPALETPAGQRRRQQYLDLKNQNDELLLGGVPDEDLVEEGPASSGIETPTDADLSAFAMEAQLRDFIIENISQIPIGGCRMRLYVDGSGRSGREYPTGVGPIDILAVDEAGNFLVFELKLDRGPDRALGQLARYMGWVNAHLAGDRAVRGAVVARSIGERLRYAACVVPNVALLEYEVQFKIRDVEPISAQPNNALQPTTEGGVTPNTIPGPNRR